MRTERPTVGFCLTDVQIRKGQRTFFVLCPFLLANSMMMVMMVMMVMAGMVMVVAVMMIARLVMLNVVKHLYR